jgi:hypothetical protein
LGCIPSCFGSKNVPRSKSRPKGWKAGRPDREKARIFSRGLTFPLSRRLKIPAANCSAASTPVLPVRGGKSGQHRAPRHLTGGVPREAGGYREGHRELLPVSAEGRRRQTRLRLRLQRVKVKTCGKSARRSGASRDADKPRGLKCHVHLASRKGPALLAPELRLARGVGSADPRCEPADQINGRGLFRATGRGTESGL